MPIDSRDWYKRKVRCPFCGNAIYPRQSHCSFCGRDLPVSPRPRGPLDWEKEQRTKKPRDGTGADDQKTTEDTAAPRKCPACEHISLFWNARDGNHECLNPDCQATGKTPDAVFSWKSAIGRVNEEQEHVAEKHQEEQEHMAEKKDEKQEHVAEKKEEAQEQEAKKQEEKFPTDGTGLAKSEHPVLGRAWWGDAYYDAKKGKWRTPARSPLWIVKLCLNLLILVGLGFLIGLGYKVFTQQTEPLEGAIILILGITGWILIIKLSRSRRFRLLSPSFTLTAFSVIAILLILSFAGVQPFSTYKDKLVNSIATYFGNTNQPNTTSFPSDMTRT